MQALPRFCGFGLGCLAVRRLPGSLLLGDGLVRQAWHTWQASSQVTGLVVPHAERLQLPHRAGLVAVVAVLNLPRA